MSRYKLKAVASAVTVVQRPSTSRGGTELEEENAPQVADEPAIPIATQVPAQQPHLTQTHTQNIGYDPQHPGSPPHFVIPMPLSQYNHFAGAPSHQYGFDTGSQQPLYMQQSYNNAQQHYRPQPSQSQQTHANADGQRACNTTSYSQFTSSSHGLYHMSANPPPQPFTPFPSRSSSAQYPHANQQPYPPDLQRSHTLPLPQVVHFQDSYWSQEPQRNHDCSQHLDEYVESSFTSNIRANRYDPATQVHVEFAPHRHATGMLELGMFDTTCAASSSLPLRYFFGRFSSFITLAWLLFWRRRADYQNAGGAFGTCAMIRVQHSKAARTSHSILYNNICLGERDTNFPCKKSVTMFVMLRLKAFFYDTHSNVLW
jgi:hypothetical protein